MLQTWWKFKSSYRSHLIEEKERQIEGHWFDNNNTIEEKKGGGKLEAMCSKENREK